MTVSWWSSVFSSPQSHQFVLQPQASKRANHHRDATPLGSKGKWQETANCPEHGVPLNPFVNLCISFHFLSKHWHLHFLSDTPPHHHHHRLIFHRVQPLYRNRAVRRKAMRFSPLQALQICRQCTEQIPMAVPKYFGSTAPLSLQQQGVWSLESRSLLQFNWLCPSESAPFHPLYEIIIFFTVLQ